MARLVANVRVAISGFIAFTPAYPRERQRPLSFSDRAQMDHVTLIV
jgi:hypothetical protein